MKHQQKGFAVLETLLIVIILAIIGGTGYYVWHSKNVTIKVQNDATSVAQTTSQNQQHPKVKCAAGFTGAVSGKGAFSICLPKGWEVMKNTTSDEFAIWDKQPEADPAKSLRITNVTGFATDGAPVFDVGIISTDASSDSLKGETSTISLASGQVATKHKHTITAQEACTGYPDCRQEGDIAYIYTVKLSGKRELKIDYNVFVDDETNNVQLVEQIVHSITVL